MSPKGVAKVQDIGFPEHGGPPPRYVQHIRSSILKHIGLTRLGTASSAADFGALGLPKESKILEKQDLKVS